MSNKNNTDLPVLVIIKRGRGNKGYIVTPADSDNPFPCFTAEDIGLACLEILNDEGQPRLEGKGVSKEEPAQQEASEPGTEPHGEDDPPPPPPQDDENPYAGQSDAFGNLSPTDRAVVSGLNWLMQKTRSASNHGRRGKR